MITQRGNVGLWKITCMPCFICHKIGHLTRDNKFYNQSPNQLEDKKGKRVVDMEFVRSEMNKMWVKKEDNNEEVKIVDQGPSSLGVMDSSSN